MAGGAVRFKCWTCETVYDVREDPPTKGLPECCSSTLRQITDGFSTFMLKNVHTRMTAGQQDQARINNKLADLAITSDDPELKKLALRWRNREQS